MKRSKLLLIFIFIITAVLGGTAIWIGWRLSKEEEVTPEESEAATWTNCNWCNGVDVACGSGHNHYYSKQNTEAEFSCSSYQHDKSDGTGAFRTMVMGPDPRNMYELHRCNSRGECIDRCGGGYACSNVKREWDWSSCGSCKTIDDITGATLSRVPVKAYSWSVYPSISNGSREGCPGGDERACLIEATSKMDFRIRLYDSNNSLVVPEVILLKSDPTIQCAKIPNSTDLLQWDVASYERGDKLYQCEVEYVFEGLSLTPGGTYRVEVVSRLGDNRLWRDPDMLITGENITGYNEIPYQLDVDGDGVLDPGPYTYRQLYNAGVGDWYSWTDDQTNTCRREFTLQQEDELLTCDTLLSDVNLASITEDELRTGDVTANLTTSTTTANASIGATGYDYGASDTNFTINPDPDGATTTLTIPQGTSNGTYSLWVMVTGTGASGSIQSGCSSATSCVGGGEGCLLTFTIGEGTCDCETVTRSPSSDEIAAGSDVAFIMTAADENGNECEVDASDVHWSTTGSPSLVELAGSREPASGEAVQHHIIYQVPEDATEETQYCVSAIVDAFEQVEACQTCFDVGGVPQPAFAAVKTSEVVCINNNTAARITYTIHVRNISDVAGVIEYVEDTYDSRFQSSWVSNITPSPDSHVGNVIRWDNNDLGYTLQANDGAAGGDDEVEFGYIVTVPSEYFGAYEDEVFVPYQYRNDAIVKPEDQDEILLHTIVEIICAVPTGVINGAVTSVLVGLLLIMFGAIFLRMHDFTYKYLTPIEKTVLKAKEVGNSIRKRIYARFKLNKKERFEKDTVRKIEKKK